MVGNALDGICFAKINLQHVIATGNKHFLLGMEYSGTTKDPFIAQENLEFHLGKLQKTEILMEVAWVPI